MATAERWYATGRRKEATARVYLSPGSGTITVNKRNAKDYFKRDVLLMIIGQPFEVVDSVNQYDVTVNVGGGGLSGQADAVKHGVSRALLKVNPENRGALKKAGFLTRDARVVERKKYGQPGARKRFQFSKR
jgi:small subunit ribosomal protein S9